MCDRPYKITPAKESEGKKITGNSVLNSSYAVPPDQSGFASVLVTLEIQLEELDRIGAAKAAARLDAAIQQLRRDMERTGQPGAQSVDTGAIHTGTYG